mmetsp:Transcript_20765/g.34321  ORF Transcript_20765/g.34321 Transcript_20765/m.34321 type:complete len:243 (-) Transcript_20765:108-836(-)
MNRFHQKLKSLGCINWRSKTTLVPNECRIPTVLCLDYLFKGMVRLATDLHSLLERRCPGWDHEKLLERQLVSSVLPSVDNVKARNWHCDLGLFVSCKISNVSVKWHLAGSCPSLSSSHRYTQDCVCPKSFLVWSTIKVDHSLVKTCLVFNRHANNKLFQLVVHVGDCLHNSLSTVPIAAVTKFTGLIRPSTRPGWHNGPEHAIFRRQINLNSWVSATVQNLARVQSRDRRRVTHISSRAKAN